MVRVERIEDAGGGTTSNSERRRAITSCRASLRWLAAPEIHSRGMDAPIGLPQQAPRPTGPVPQITLRAISRIALYYGIAGFGGGYSVLSQLRRDLVERRRWLSADDFLVLAELSKSLPGTPATSLLALLGQRVGGLAGGLLAAVAFLLPSMVLMMVCAAAYSLVRKATGLTVFFDGMNAAMVGVVAAVTLDLGRTALRSRAEVLAALACAVLLATRLISEPVVAACAVILGGMLGMLSAQPKAASRPFGSVSPAGAREIPKSTRLHSLSWLAVPHIGMLGPLAGLMQVFIPIGVMTFGGGLAMIPAIEHMVVIDRHWLDPKAFADTIALGQITPGPVAICATFIGYRVGGIAGALIATIAMFGPSILLTMVAGRSVTRFHGSPLVRGALRALAPAVIGMLLAATLSLGRSSVEAPLDAVVAVGTFVLLARFSLSPLWLLIGGGLVHLGASMLLRSG